MKEVPRICEFAHFYCYHGVGGAPLAVHKRPHLIYINCITVTSVINPKRIGHNTIRLHCHHYLLFLNSYFWRANFFFLQRIKHEWLFGKSSGIACKLTWLRLKLLWVDVAADEFFEYLEVEHEATDWLSWLLLLCTYSWYCRSCSSADKICSLRAGISMALAQL